MVNDIHRRAFLALGGAALLALPQIAQAAGSTTTSVTSGTLTGPVSATLVGTTSGAFATYQFTYPGNSSAVTLVLTVDQPNALRSFPGVTQDIYHTPSSAAGINVYQGGVLMVTSSQSTPNTATAVFSSAIGGPVTVQVYDYYTTAPINFTLTPTGLPAQPGATTTTTTTTSVASTTVSSTSSAAPTTSAATAAISGTLSGPVSATLVGTTSGAFATYQFIYPGNSSAVTLVLTVDQPNALRSFPGVTQDIYHTPSSAAGINVLQDGVLKVTSSQSTPNTATAVFSSAIGGPVTVQVYDYYTTAPINFNLTPTGLPS